MASRDSFVDRQSLLSWPGLLVFALATWGILTTAPPWDSGRKDESGPPEPETAAGRKVSARLWQDPLAAVYLAAAKNPNSSQEAKDLVHEALSRPTDDSAVDRIVFLGVLVPNNQYQEGAEQCRRRRYAVLHALGAAGFTPRHSDSLRFISIPRGGVGPQAGPPLLIPCEWFEPEREPGGAPLMPTLRRTRVLVYWLDESRLGDVPLAALSAVVGQWRAALPSKSEDVATPAVAFRFLGPISSTTLWAMERERTTAAPSFPELSDSVFYNTQCTATDIRRRLGFAPPAGGPPPAAEPGVPQNLTGTVPNFEHWIGVDEDLAVALAHELALRGVRAESDRIALIAEWDTHYGRNILATCRQALVNRANDKESARRNVTAISYLRGLDGRLPNESSSAGAGDRTSLDAAEGKAQIDYVRRFIENMKHEANVSKERKLKAIGVLGSDVYDKLLLISALRFEFPDALFFTTDLDDRLLSRTQLPWTHNLLIASHFDLRLSERLQAATPPLRGVYQTSVYLGCLAALEHDGLLDGRPELKEAVHKARQFVHAQLAHAWQLPTTPDANRDHDNARSQTLMFEVGRTGPFNLARMDESHPVHPVGNQAYAWPQRRDQSLLVVVALLTALFLVPFAGPLQDMALAAYHRKLDWRHTLAAVGVVLLAAACWLIDYDSSNPNGEPFALFAGISVWPTVLLRLLLVGFCLGFVFVYTERLKNSIDQIDADLCLSAADVSSAGGSGVRRHESRRMTARLKLRDAIGRRLRGVEKSWLSWIANNRIAAWGQSLLLPESSGLAKSEPHLESALVYWGQYRQRLSWLSRHSRLLPHLATFLLLVVTLFVVFGMATSPARGPLCIWVNRVLFVVCSVVVLWLMFFVLDAVRLCDRLVRILGVGRVRWPANVLKDQAVAHGLPAGDERLDAILDHWVDVQVAARHAGVVMKLVYAPSVAMLIAFVSRHGVFDNFSWSPPMIISFSLSLGIVLYCAWLLSNSTQLAKQQALDTVERLLQELPPDDSHRKAAERIQREIDSIHGDALTPLRSNPIIAAALLPFGSAGTLATLEFVVGRL